MVQNKKVSAGLALIAGLLGTCASGAALALPEMEVGSRPGIAAQAQSVEPADAAVAENTDTMPADEDAASASD
ncbi:hypothetical protein IA69_30665 [Massilia sp. JS1662]|nr:hypothetical protein [Massilia sp. JS1662]KGF78369.1 hypothetical protein IA69_30665 [Massilia sp. JS1662]